MKKFAFALNRVLEWRHAQAQRQELKLKRLYDELSALATSQAALRDQRGAVETELGARTGAAGSVLTGEDLGALHAIQEHVAAEHARIAQARLGCEQQIAVQRRILTTHRREVKLLEKLKEQRRTVWLSELDREISQQAEESHLAKWNRERR
jgi:flagellar export protein FliJ